LDFLQGDWTNSEDSRETYLVTGRTVRRTNKQGVRTFQNHLVWEEKWQTLSWGGTRRYYLDKPSPKDEVVQWADYKGGKPFRWHRPNASPEDSWNGDSQALPKPKARPRLKEPPALKESKTDEPKPEEEPTPPKPKDSHQKDDKAKAKAKPRLMRTKAKAAATNPSQPPRSQDAGAEAQKAEPEKDANSQPAHPAASESKASVSGTSAPPKESSRKVKLETYKEVQQRSVRLGDAGPGKPAQPAEPVYGDILGADPGWERERLIARSLLAQGFQLKGPDPEEKEESDKDEVVDVAFEEIPEVVDLEDDPREAKRQRTVELQG